jgi:hypothetical protein
MLGLPDGAFDAPGLAHDSGCFKENLMLIIALILISHPRESRQRKTALMRSAVA